jgi:myo-inositol-1(or 4)-monophosphatase
MHPFLRACLEANREISRHLAHGIIPEHRVKSTVGAGGDISSGIDLIAEAIFVRHLESFGQIHSEESGVIGEGDHTIILDPIDGSSNILSGFPYYGTSAALIDPEGITIAAVICNLASQQIFFKIPNTPARHGTLSSDVFDPYLLEQSSKIGLFERAYAHPNAVRALGEQGLKFRAPGAVALSLVYALRGRFFLYVGQCRHYDFAAGLLFLEEMECLIADTHVIAAHDRSLVDRLVSLI